MEQLQQIIQQLPPEVIMMLLQLPSEVLALFAQLTDEQKQQLLAQLQQHGGVPQAQQEQAPVDNGNQALFGQ